MLRLKIGGVPEHFNLPWRLAMEEGKFRQENIHLHWEDMAGGTGQMIRGLESGSLDVAVLLTEGITKYILEGLPAKIIQIYVTTPLRWGIHVPKNADIREVKQLEGKTFAISRTGSGSHLMSYVLADREGWNSNDLKFNVIGDVYGGLWALEHNEAQAFLWEHFTTKPHVDAGKCNYIGDVVTPWPCFCIAVRNEIYDKYLSQLQTMCQIVNDRARELKSAEDAVEMIAWRYNLQENDVKQWLQGTDWNYDGASNDAAFELTVNYLLKLGLINADQAIDFETKLF
jgi:sulfonate transport system substrate-binding protein